MTSFKLLTSIAGLLFLLTSFRVTQSFNPLATEKVLGYFGGLDTKFRSIDFWKKLITGALDADVSNSDILDEIKLVTVQIKELGIELDHKIDKSVMLTAERIRAFDQVDVGIRDLITRIDNIDYMYDEYFSRINNNKYDTPFLPEYVNKMIKGEEGPKFEIYKMNRLFYPNRTSSIEESLFTHIHNQIMLINRERCDDKFSPQLWLFNIYMNVMVTEVKAFLMTTLAYSIEEKLYNVSRSHSMSSFTEEFGDRISNHLASFREQLSKTPRFIRRCDPANHERGKTFVELERLMQIYLIREDQHPNHTTCNSCRTLPPIDGENLVLIRDGNAYLRIQPICNGTVFRCGQYVNQHILYGDICVMPPDSMYFYEWFTSNRYDKYTTHGNRSNCPGTIADYKRTLKPRWWTHEPEDCPPCACLCVGSDHTRTIQSFSTRPQISTFRANMVVVGVRIVEQNKMLHIQIKEGHLQPGGRINPHSEAWVDLEKMDFETKKIDVVEYNKKETRRLDKGLDYENFEEYGFRFAIEDLMAPKGSAIVGVRFTPLNSIKNNFKAIGLEIMTAPFNWTTGEILKEGKWMTNMNDRKVVKERKDYENAKRMFYSNIPTKSRVNLPTLEESVIEFDIANPEIDAGHTVIPFFDALPVTGNPAMPLGGIGLIYKTSPGYGGFITPRIHHIDLADYMDHNNFNEYL